MSYGESAGGFLGNIIAGLMEAGIERAISEREQRRLAYKRSADPLPPRAQEACERAVHNALARVPDALANALHQPALKLCTELLLHESYVSKRKSAAGKYTDIFTMVVYWLLHDPERRLWLPRELIRVNEDEVPIPVSLDTLHANVARAIESMGAVLRHNCASDGEPLPGLWHKYRVNGDVASGIDRADPRTTRKQPVLPTQAKAQTPRELIDAYLRGTPFTEFFNTTLPVSFPLEDRFAHMHIVGGSGHGKTQLLQQLLCSDLSNVVKGKRSVVVIDSQGDLFNAIQSLAVLAELNDHRVVIIDPTDIAAPPSLNLFDFGLDRLGRYNALERETLINGAIALYEYVFGALLGAELTQRQRVIFRYLARLMMKVPGATIHTLMDFMHEPELTRPYLAKLTDDPMTRKFFQTQFFSDTFDDTRQQILTRLWGVLENRTLARMFGSTRNKVNLFEAMNRGSLILIHTAKDLLKQEGCEILGRFFIALIAQAAQERAALPREQRLPTFVYIDEAHDYFDESIEHLLTEARKQNVGLLLAHQFLGQFTPRLHEAVATNTAIKIVGGLSDDDARAFAREMGCEPEFLRSMKKQQRVSHFACFIRNRTSRPFLLPVTLGRMEGMPKLSPTQLAGLRELNRSLYCGTDSNVSRAPDQPPKGQPGSPLGKPELL
jgi:hypothetical protein